MAKPPARGVTVILPYSGPARTTLLRVRELMRYGVADLEIIVVSTGPLPVRDQASVQSFITTHPNVRLLVYTDSPPPAVWLNRAARKAAGACLLFIQSDIHFGNEAAGLMERLLDRAMQPNIGNVGCLLLDAKKQRIIHAGIYQLPDQSLSALYAQGRLSQAIGKLGTRTFPYDIRKSRPVLAVAGAVAVSRSIFRSLGGFREDASLTMAQLLVLLCLQGNQAGRQTWYAAGGSLVAGNGVGGVQLPATALAALREAPRDTFSAEALPPRPRPKLELRWPWQRR